jgi:hypothetical protein
MTGRERLLAAYTRRPKDRVPWVPIVFPDTISRYSDEERESGPIAFTRRIGADILWRWGDFLVTHSPVACRQTRTADRRVRVWETPAGRLREVQEGSRLLEHKLESPDDLPAYRYLVENTSFSPNPGRYEELADQVGDDGIVATHIGPTAVQQLVQLDAGVDNFAYLCADCPDEMDKLIELLHLRDLERIRIAAETPAKVLIQVENTSTLLISPGMYRRWSQRHIADFCRIAHDQNKVAMVHMCGHIRDLLADIAATGLDGIDALTPPPTANTTPEDAWDVIGPNLIVHGILDPTRWIHRPTRDIVSAMERALPPGMKDKNFLLCTAADGLPDIPREAWDVLADAWHRFSDR